MYEVYADGIAWVDSDGRTEWPHSEAIALCDVLKHQGYKVVMPVRV